MADPPKEYKASWIVSFKYQFGDEEQYAWTYNYSEGADWTAKRFDWLDKEVEDCEAGWAKLSERGESDKLKKVVDKLNDIEEFKKSKIVAGNITSWIPTENNNNKSLNDKAIAILLNHIVASRSTEPLSVLMSVVGKHGIVEIRGLKPGQPCWFYTLTQERNLLLAKFLLGFPDLFLPNPGENERQSKTEWKDIERIISAHRQRINISVLNYTVRKTAAEEYCILRLRMDTTLCRYERGALCNCIPIPGKPIKKKPGDPEEPYGVYSPEVVISSPVVEKAIKSLSDVWQDKAKAILVSGPPGSGKENFALSIPYGSGRKSDEDSERIPTISLANGTPEQQEKQIFGYQQADGSIVDGLLAKAKDSAIVIDEAHYPLKKPGVRASLLRALEAKEYYPVDSLEILEVVEVQWIFASSLPLDGSEKSLSKVPPEDFWTRMTHQIRIEHPLSLKAYRHSGIEGFDKISKKQGSVLRDLFKFFWWDCAKAHFGIDPVRVLSAKVNSDDMQRVDAADRLIRGYLQILLEETYINIVAEMFSNALLTTVGSQALTEVSIRGLRSMVSRIFSKCVGLVTTGSDEKYGLVFMPAPSIALEDELASPQKKLVECQKKIDKFKKKKKGGWKKRVKKLKKQKDTCEKKIKAIENYNTAISQVNEEIFEAIREIQQIARLKP